MADLPISILIVEDEESLAGIIATQLEEEFGYMTRIAHNGREAVEILSGPGLPPSVVLTDFSMPEMTGMELLEWIKDHGLEVPVIMMTAAGSDTVAAEAMKLGAYDYLRKEDIELTRLGTTIRGTLERRRLRAVESIERARSEELSKNQDATNRVQSILAGLSPLITDSIAGINAGLEHLASHLQKLNDKDRQECAGVVQELKDDSLRLEHTLKALLDLYALTYAHHTHLPELKNLEASLPRRRST